MSFSLTAVSLTGAVVGTSGTMTWTTQAQSAGYAVSDSIPHLALLNESPCGLQIQFHTGEQMSLPAGGWQTIALNPNCTSLDYQVLYVLNATPIVASLLGTWYAPGEAVPTAPILGNSPIGASVAISPIANELQGVNQTSGLTEYDGAGTDWPWLVPISQVNIGLKVGAYDNLGNRVLYLVCDPGLTKRLMIEENVFLDTGVGMAFTPTGSLTLPATINNNSVVGTEVGLVVASQPGVVVTATTLQTILTYTTIADSQLLVSGHANVKNGVSGNVLTFQLAYTDLDGVASTVNLPMFQGTAGVTVFSGATSIANVHWVGLQCQITAKSGTTVTVTYRDPTNTPNDTISAVITRVS